MTTTIYLDKKTKEKAAKRAKKDKLSMSSVMRMLLSDYADGNIVIGANWVRIDKVEEVPVNKEIQKEINKVMKIWNKRDNERKLKAKKL